MSGFNRLNNHVDLHAVLMKYLSSVFIDRKLSKLNNLMNR